MFLSTLDNKFFIQLTPTMTKFCHHPVWEIMSENLRGGGFFLTHTVDTNARHILL